MKNYIFLCSALLLMLVSLKAQVNVNVSLPFWGPAITTEEYYYLPDIDSYYDIRQSQFIYLNKGVWIRSRTLPNRYRNYNLNSGRVIVLKEYRGNSPYAHFKNHKVKYYGNTSQWKGVGEGKALRGKGKNNRNKKEK